MDMTSDSWFSLYPSDLIADTVHLSNADFGAYMRLLCYYYLKGPPPNDEEALRNIMRVERADWIRTKGNIVDGFLTLHADGHYHQKRADEEIAKRDKINDRLASISKLGVEKRRQLGLLPPEPCGEPDGEPEGTTVGLTIRRTQPQPQPQPQDTSTAKSSIDQAIDVYGLYPRKIGKPAALRAIKRQIDKFGLEVVMSATRRFAEAWNGETDLTFCPYPSTWFNQERFNDAPETWRPSAGGPKPQRPNSNEVSREQIEKLNRTIASL